MIVNEETPVSTAELVKSQGTAVQEFHPADENRPMPLFSHDEGEELRRRWADVQTRFVDDPAASVKAADELVAATIRRLTEVFADERGRLEKDWGAKDQVSTEDLRQAFRRYRSFFDRLLSI
jgi:predicted nuclease with RNAse H fold